MCRGERRTKTGADEFQLGRDEPLRELHLLLSDLLEEAARGGSAYPRDVRLKDTAAGRRIAALERAAQCEAVSALAARLRALEVRHREFYRRHGRVPDVTAGWEDICKPRAIFGAALREMLRRKLPLSASQVQDVAALVAGGDRLALVEYPIAAAAAAVENFASENELPPELRRAVGRLVSTLRAHEGGYPERRKAAERLEKVLGTGPQIMIQPGEAWSDLALTMLAGIGPEARAHWAKLLEHCRDCSASRPAAKWLKTADALVQAVGRKQFRDFVLAWFPLVDQPRTQRIEEWPRWRPDPNQLIIDPHADILKGLAWCCGQLDDKEIARALTALAISAYSKVPGIGPRAVRIGNACVHALGAMPGMEGVGQLALLKVKVRFRTAQKGIEKALNASAERLGVPAEELEEMAVPAYGLTEVGVLSEPMGQFTARLSVTGTNATELLWIGADGKPQKSVPAGVRKDFADELKDLKASARDIQKMLPAQRERIDRLFLQQKSWKYPLWRQRYLDHPLVGTLARRIVWRFTTAGRPADGIYLDGGLVGVDGEPIAGLGEDTTVELWHPIGHEAGTIVAWRERLEAQEISQPFKQAHREVYYLTDAERQTRTYSNRFAAHVVRQHQFNALCAVRGWKNTLKLLVDDEFPPATRELPPWGLRAEFWTDGAGDEYGVDTNDTGTFHRLATDQVRFFRIDAPRTRAHAGARGQPQTADPVPLEDVPPLVFSEVMRDVDLFVGVASVGNDPTWFDGGPQGRYRDYWQSYSFGDLSASAETRKQVLQRLVPRLRIAGRCSFAEKFLVVRGDLRTYKIHLGSGNVLMEPNDEYLCIVPGRGAGGPTAQKLFLPFEGDRTMSIVLSKAFLLAQDKKIRDDTIVSQIRGR